MQRVEYLGTPALAESRFWPDPCPKCGVEAKLRKLCENCEEAVYVIEHQGTHYMGGGTNEVIPCKCARYQERGENSVARRIRGKRDMRRKYRDAGKLYPPTNPKHVTTPEMAEKAALNLAEGKSIRQSLLEAGFPQKTAEMGKRAINGRIQNELLKLGGKYIRLGRQLTPEDQEAMVRGRLAEDVILGNDKGVMAAKQLGADKRISMWQPDSQVGMVVLQAPVMPKIDDAEVPIIETRFQKESAMLEAKQSQEEGPEHEETPAEPEPREEDEYEQDEYEQEEEKHAS